MEKDLIKVDVCIIGGGVLGLWTGLELAKQGKKIMILDKTHIGSIKNNTDVCLNFPNSDYMAELTSLALNKWLKIKDKYEDLKIEIKGSISFALNKTEKNILENIQELQTQANKDAGSFLLNDRKAIKTLLNINEIGEEVISALVNVGDLNLENQNCLDFLRNNLIKSGAQFWGSDEVLDFEIEDNTITQVNLKDSTIQAEQFVLATGARSVDLLKNLGLRVPIRPAKAHIIEYTSKAQLPKQILHYKGQFGDYISKPMLNGRHLLVYTGIEDQLQATWSTNVDQQTITNTLLEMIRILPIMQYSDLQNYTALTLAVSPDRMPYFGKTKHFNNLYFNIGYNGCNYLLAPFLGEQMANLIENNTHNTALDFLNPDRFDTILP